MSKKPEFTDQQVAAARATAGRSLARAAEKSSQQLESFGTWLLAGEAGALILWLGSQEQPSAVLSVGSMPEWFLLLVTSILLGTLQKFVASLIAASASIAEDTLTLLADAKKDNVEFDLSTFLFEIGYRKGGLLRPFSFVFRDDAIEGQYALVGKRLRTMAHGHSLLVVAQIGFATTAFWTLFMGSAP